MKTVFMAVAALATLAAPAAFAQSAINLNANVTSACGVGFHRSGATAAPGWTQGDVTGLTLVDGNGQLATQTVATNRSFGNLWCNGGGTVSMSVSSLTSTTPALDSGSFTNSFNVRVKTDMGVYMNAGEDLLITSNGGAAGTATGANAGAFETGLQRFSGVDSIEVLADASNRRPVAGTYSAAITLTVTSN